MAQMWGNVFAQFCSACSEFFTGQSVGLGTEFETVGVHNRAGVSYIAVQCHSARHGALNGIEFEMFGVDGRDRV